MEIKPTYVNFSQALLLKEKGFDVRLKKVYNILGELWDSHYQYMENSNPDCGAVCVAPEQWVVVEWFRLKHGIWINIVCDYFGKNWYVELRVSSEEIWSNVNKRRDVLLGSSIFLHKASSPQEATSSAIDYVLTNLI